MTVSAERSEASPGASTRLPDFFIVGHAKSGTTALYEMLKQHPRIFMPVYKGGAGKEPWFFAADNPHPQEGRERSVAFTGRGRVTMQDYLALFARAAPQQIVGEASTSYLWSRSAANRIAQARPDARIIAIFREPAAFLRSVHLQLLQNHHESERNFRKAVGLDEARREGRHIPRHSYWPQALIYSDRVRYAEQLRRYHAAFPREQVLVLIYDDFLADNEGTLARVLRFLDVDDGVSIAPLRANPTVGVRSTRLNDLRLALRDGRGPLLSAVRGTGKAITSKRLRELLYYPLQRRAVYRPAPPPDEAFMLELRRRFKGEVAALSEYLGRDLVGLWGYDELD
jgi:Sulfotransferase family